MQCVDCLFEGLLFAKQYTQLLMSLTGGKVIGYWKVFRMGGEIINMQNQTPVPIAAKLSWPRTYLWIVSQPTAYDGTLMNLPCSLSVYQGELILKALFSPKIEHFVSLKIASRYV